MQTSGNTEQQLQRQHWSLEDLHDYNNSKEEEKLTSMNMIFLEGMKAELQCSPMGGREGGSTKLRHGLLHEEAFIFFLGGGGGRGTLDLV